MCADDVVCSRRRAARFLDYVAVGRLDPAAVAELVGGVAAGCREAGCALVGGETAEHPGLMDADDVRPRRAAASASSSATRVIDGSAVRAGDAIVGLAVVRAPRERLLARPRARRRSGTSTSREPYQERLRRTLGDAAADDALAAEPARGAGDARRGPADADADLRPADPRRSATALARPGYDLRGLAHITGGGLPGNVPRALPDGLGGAAGPGALADAVGHAPVRRARRARRRRAAGDVQRRARDGRRRARRRRSRRRSRRSRAHGIAATVVGEVVDGRRDSAARATSRGAARGVPR